MKSLIYIVLVGGLLAGLLFLFAYAESEWLIEPVTEEERAAAVARITPTSQPSQVTNARRSFTSDSYNMVQFSLDLPQRAVVEQIDEQRYEIKYVGPDSEEGSAVTDGYLLTLYLTTDEELATYSGQFDAVSELKYSKVSDYTAVTYETDGMLGAFNSMHYVISDTPDSTAGLLDVSISTVGREREEYQREARAIIGSLTFFPTPAEVVKDTSTIHVDEPENGVDITSPLLIRGTATVEWFLDRTFTVMLESVDGTVLAQSSTTPLVAWRGADANLKIPFESKIVFDATSSTSTEFQLVFIGGAMGTSTASSSPFRHVVPITVSTTQASSTEI